MVDAERRGRGGVVEAVDVGGQVGGGVELVDPAAGEHEHVGGEGGPRRAAQDEGLDAATIGVPDEDVFASVVALAIVLTLLLQALPAAWLADRLGLLERPRRPVAVEQEAA